MQILFPGSWIDWTDLHLKNYYSPEQAYGNSKAAQIVFTKQLARMLDTQGEDVKCYSLHPGVVYTDLYVNVWWMKIFYLAAKYVIAIQRTITCQYSVLQIGDEDSRAGRRHNSSCSSGSRPCHLGSGSSS